MTDRTTLEGRTALVTGASSGLGAHFARVLAAAGASVILAARRRDALETLAAAVGDRASIVVLDVTDPASIATATADLPPIDILVNNAGVVRDALALNQSEADWDAVIDTNLRGVFQVAQAVARNMIAHGRGGAIVNIASILGLRQGATVLPYAVSKAGVVQMTKVLALEWARHGIRVNALAPGYFDTDLNREFWSTDAGKAMLKRIPQRRLGQLSDLDMPLLLLAGPGSAYMTGSILAVDGGHLVSTL
ncbi:SDR family oxidoreductase [Sphingomonadaceae bacterium jetA1]|jgi:NAD(P)-dependent dehydrogenase (short-subunit alcohol dehydrogenase family)|uniref:SDR family NAD(P)-dependent oxidoreductase n=1 Tax=Facivitalis istanbulensis TaxID=3075838 RepID=UPI00349863BE